MNYKTITMKKLFYFFILSLSFTLISSISFNANNDSSIVTSKSQLSNDSFEVAQDWYATTGTTRNTYGTNYSISIRVKGYAGYGGCVSISTVQASSGGSWSSVSYYSVYGEECTYYISVGGQSYYFSI